MIRPKSVSRDAGFTLIELLTVLLVGLILMTVAAPELFKYYIRSRFEGLTREVSFVMQKAKYQAIKNSQPEQVCAGGREITGLGQTIELPDTISFGAPDGQDAITEHLVTDGGCFIFQTDGSVKASGSFRFVDVRGNYLEIEVNPQATGRVQVHKWDEDENAWFSRDKGGKAWTWKTGNIL
jgi:prepilin-type N-terminal cleavage/methylation domain-containing protein